MMPDLPVQGSAWRRGGASRRVRTRLGTVRPPSSLSGHLGRGGTRVAAVAGACRSVAAPLLGDRAVADVALGGGEVSCPVAAAAAAQAVVARTARYVVAAAVAAQQIVAIPASQRVVVALGQQQVGAGTAGQRVLAAAADRDRHL